MKRIVLTGGGTAGHVTPNLALLPYFQDKGCEVSYIGSYDGIEKGLVEAAGVPYYGISSGKLRRYFDPKNFSDPFKVMPSVLITAAPLGETTVSVALTLGHSTSQAIIFWKV